MLKKLNIDVSHNFKVDAKNPWNPSGVLLEPGFTYRIEVLSIDEPWIDDTIPATPDDGQLNTPWYLKFFFLWKRYRKVNWYVLTGSIGKNKHTYFKIGNTVIYTVPISTLPAELYCFANDAFRYYGNNHGKLSMKISRIKSS